MSINTVTITGNLTRDVDMRSTADGMPVMSFSVAVNDRRKGPDGQWKDYPNYVDCTMFGSRAEAVGKYMATGTKVGIAGKLRYASWEKDGQKRSKLEVIVDDIELLGGKQEPAETAYSSAEIPF